MDVLLNLAKKNVAWSSGAHPHDHLLEFALMKLTRHGSINDALALWKNYAPAGNNSNSKSKKFLEDETLVSAIVSKAFSRKHKTEANVLEQLRGMATENCWDESPQYFCILLGNLRDHFRTLAKKNDDDVCLIEEKSRLDAVTTRAAACLPLSWNENNDEIRLDSHSMAVISAMKVQCLVALAAVQRVRGDGDSSFLSEAKEEFRMMLQLDAQASAANTSNITPKSGVIDSGDVVSGSETNTKTSHLTELQKGLLEVIKDQRLNYKKVCREENVPFSHMLRASLVKRTIPSSKIYDGVDVGANYKNFNKEEHSRRALIEILREISLCNQGKRVIICVRKIVIIYIRLFLDSL